MLCSICEEVIKTRKDTLLDEDGTTLCAHHLDGESLHNAAKEECHICSLVWHSLAPSQQSYLLQLNVEDPVTIMLMTTPQAMELPLAMFGQESLILYVQFEAARDIWKVPGGNRERSNMFVFQPSDGTD